MKTTLKRKPRNAHGFSLVEIVVAVAIVATVMVALMGMIPTGLNTVKQASHTMSEIRIAQQIIGEVQMTEWNELRDWEVEGPYYYDREGNKLENSEDPRKLYTCVVELTNPPTLPGAAHANTYLQRILVKVSHKRGTSVFTPEQAGKAYQQFPGYAVKLHSDYADQNF